MLTKTEKTQQIEKTKQLITASKNAVFADFTGVPTKLVNKLKKDLKTSGATYMVLKKRLAKIAFKNAGFDFDPTQFEQQFAVMFLLGDLSSAASAIYKFAKDAAKEKKEFKILGAYDFAVKTFVTAEQFTAIAKLPSREVLLGMVLGAITGPLRAFMYVLQEKAKKMVEAK